MTRRRDLESHRRSLGEIRNIMNSMKTLAYMETRKLSRFLDAQHSVIQNIEKVAQDLLGFHREILPAETEESTSVYILIGTERGFCGDFNYVLLKHLDSVPQSNSPDASRLIVVGRKLHTLLEGDARVTAFIEGAGIVEEVTSLLKQVVSEIINLQKKHGLLTVTCLYHGSQDGVIMQKLLPPFQQYLNHPPPYQHPPTLNQSPEELLMSLIDHYLFAALHEILFTSLMVENYHRVAHLEGAVKRLDDKSEELTRQCNALRQEEIIEEIEVILLSSADPL